MIRENSMEAIVKIPVQKPQGFAKIECGRNWYKENFFRHALCKKRARLKSEVNRFLIN